MPLFDDKNIVEYLYQTKDTESHEDSDFCYDWGVRMCEFCSYKNNPFIIYGKEIKINKCAKETDLTEAQVMRNRDDDVPGIVIYKGCIAAGYFDINYCPICGRKLVE